MTQLLLQTLECIIGFFAFTNNTCLLLTYAFTRQLHSTRYMFIASLSIADLLMGFVMILRILPFIAQACIESHSTSHQLICALQVCLELTSGISSISSIMLIITDQYLYVIKPLKYINIVTKSRKKTALLIVWAVALAYGLLPLFFTDYQLMSDREGCDADILIPDIFFIVYIVFFNASLPLAAFIYYRIMTVVVRHKTIMLRQLNIGSTSPIKPQSPKGVKGSKFFLVCLIFYILWYPLVIALTLHLISGVPVIAVRITTTVAASNSAFNFVIYVYMRKEFKLAFLKLFCRCCQRSAESIVVVDERVPMSLSSTLMHAHQGSANAKVIQHSSQMHQTNCDSQGGKTLDESAVDYNTLTVTKVLQLSGITKIETH